MTPYELAMFIDATSERLMREQKDSLTIAWMTAYLHRVEKMPSLKEILGEDEQEVVMEQDEMLNMVKHLNAKFGGKVVEEDGGEIDG